MQCVTLDIYSLGAGSGVVAHFKCKKCGNEWDSSIANRVNRKYEPYRLIDCPNCSNSHFRSVPYSEQYSDMARMYREDLNGIPLDSIRGREATLKTKYQWNCMICGNTFESTIDAMTRSCQRPTKGCPYCSNRKMSEGKSFAEIHPELMDEYAPDNTEDPYKIFANSQKRAKWICRKCGYTWIAEFSDRHIGKKKCPICNRTEVIQDKNSFAAVFPELAKCWSPSNEKSAEEVFYNLYGWFSFICPICGGEYNSWLNEFVSEEYHNCPYCRGTRALSGYNSFADNHPDLREELDDISNYLLPFAPNKVLDNSNVKFWWTCKKDKSHKYFMSPRTRLVFEKRSREPCLYCRGHRRKLNHFVALDSEPQEQ